MYVCYRLIFQTSSRVIIRLSAQSCKALNFELDAINVTSPLFVLDIYVLGPISQ